MELLLGLIGAILRFLNWLVTPFLRFRENFNRIQVPPPRDPLLIVSATELARKIREGKLSSSELIKAYIKRIKEVNPYVNAIVEDRFREALEEAAFVDNFISNTKIDVARLAAEKPLLGVPITIKESCRLKDMELSVGNLARLNVKATEDGECVRLLKDAGAIPLLVSNTPEYCLSWETSNYITGTTRNPYNNYRTPAGSSGGEGALMGAGASILGIGSDLAGSVRLPALFNGIYGHKPTAGVVSIDGHFPSAFDKDFYKYLALGPFCRYADDLPLMMTVMAGSNRVKLNLSEPVDLSGVKVYRMREAGKSLAFVPVEEAIANAIDEAVGYLKTTMDCQIMDEEFAMKDTCELACLSLVQVKGIPNIIVSPENPKENLNLFVELIKSVFGFSRHQFNIVLFYILRYTLTMFYKKKFNSYNERVQELRQKFIHELGTNGVFIYPTFPTAAFHLNKLPLVVIATMYPLIFNILGFPCTHVPTGFDKDGMPIGFQVVAAPYQDRLCFAVAKALERKFGGWKSTPTS